MSHLEITPKENVAKEPEPEVMACTTVINPSTREKDLICQKMPDLPKADGRVIHLSAPDESAPTTDPSLLNKI